MAYVSDGGKNMKNIYLIDKTFGKYRLEVVFPSYKAIKGDLGYYYSLGISVGIGGVEDLNINIGLVIGWIRLVKYKSV